jgi:hypothetical protein
MRAAFPFNHENASNKIRACEDGTTIHCWIQSETRASLYWALRYEICLNHVMKRSIRKQTVERPFSSRRKAPCKTRPVVAAVGIGSTTPRVNPKWASHYRALLGLRERLLKERGERIAQAAEPLEPHSMDIADSAIDELDHDLALSALSAEQDALFWKFWAGPFTVRARVRLTRNCST